MELFSIQPAWIYEQLKAGQPFRATPPVCTPGSDEYDESWERAYRWLGRQMDKRCPTRRPAGVEFPLWAWHSWAGPKKRKPDLRFASTRNYANSEAAVLMTLDVPDADVLLSDYDAWHHVLNGWYLASETDSEAFEARCETNGCNPFRNKPLPVVALQAEMEATWTHIFNLDTVPVLLGSTQDEAYVQATFWELRPEFVREAVWFEKTGQTQKLELPSQMPSMPLSINNNENSKETR